MIVHVDIDAFFASVEQLLVPALRGRPVAVGSGCIASCSYEARAHGLSAGMSLAEARRLCPKLVILPGSYGIYRCFASAVWDICREVSPAVDTYLDDAYLDLRGTELLYGDTGSPDGPVARLRARVREETGLVLTAGVGPNRMIARLASHDAKPRVAPGSFGKVTRRGDGLGVVRPDDNEVERFLVDRPASDIPGVGPKTAGTLAKLSIRTVRDLRILSRDNLVAIFGRNGSAIYDRARGIDTRAITEREVPKTISRATTFHKETADPVEARGMLHYLVERAMKAVRELGLVARTVSVKIRYADFKRDEARTRLVEPARLEPRVYDAVLKLFARIHTRRVALRLVGVTLSGLGLDGSDQLGLIEPDHEEERRERLAGALDDVRARFGFSAITAGKSLDLLGKLRQDENGYVLRTPCLTK